MQQKMNKKDCKNRGNTSNKYVVKRVKLFWYSKGKSCNKQSRL